MKLPVIKKYFFTTIFSLLFLVLYLFNIQNNKSLATAVSTSGNQNPTSTSPAGSQNWIADPDVTFAGKNAARASQFVDWTLTNYKWSYNDSPLTDYWVKIRNIVYVFLILAIFAAASVMIVTHGNNVSIISFIRLLFLAIILIAFSFALIKLLYQITDILQGFFIRAPDGSIIGSKDLLSINIDYANFQGLRLSGTENDEAVSTSVNLMRLTTITYIIMAGILLVRKVILWFFIIISPILPILIFYIPLRNTAKIWIGEFFRWLLYAPLFCILLSGLVALWKTQISVLPFNFIPNTPYYQASSQDAAQHPYPTAINIWLGGPGQTVSMTNSLNYNDTFVQYIVALIMLWMVLLVPWLLLRIFLDYIGTVSLANNSNEINSFIKTSIARLPQSEFMQNILPGTNKQTTSVNSFKEGFSSNNTIQKFTNRIANTLQNTQNTAVNQNQPFTNTSKTSVNYSSPNVQNNLSKQDVNAYTAKQQLNTAVSSATSIKPTASFSSYSNPKINTTPSPSTRPTAAADTSGHIKSTINTSINPGIVSRGTQQKSNQQTTPENKSSVNISPLRKILNSKIINIFNLDKKVEKKI